MWLNTIRRSSERLRTRDTRLERTGIRIRLSISRRLTCSGVRWAERLISWRISPAGKCWVTGRRSFQSLATRNSLWAFEVLGELGIRYDSSVFPVLNYRYGIADAPRWPYEVDAGAQNLIEFPISTWQVWGRNLPIAGGAYFRIYPYVFTKRAFQSLNSNDRPAVFYVHPWELDADHPRIPLPRRISLTHYFNLHRTEERLRRLLRDFKFAPMSEVLGVS